MNYKNVFSSWFGLGIFMLFLQFFFQLLFKLLSGTTQMTSLAILLSGMSSAMIFTHYVYPRIMSPAFKIYAILTTFLISMAIEAGIIISYDTLRSEFYDLLNTKMQGHDTKSYVIFGSMMVVGLLFQGITWYLFITLGNKLAIKQLQPTNKL